MTADEMAKFLNQSDVLDVRGAGKAVLRKSQRQVDQSVSWAVFRRDGYKCRYCGRSDMPLTVDHADLWEDGGATVEENLITACRRCNKLRGSQPLGDWLGSSNYRRLAENLSRDEKAKNVEVLARLAKLVTMRTKPRSR